MKTSALIAKLIENIADFGDMDVFIGKDPLESASVQTIIFPGQSRFIRIQS